MAERLEDYIERTRLARTPSQLRKLFKDAVTAEGYENVVHGYTLNRQLFIEWDEFPEGYLDVYRRERWDKIDPVLDHIQAARRPFRWSDLLAKLDLSRRQQSFFHACRELGVHSGMTFPLHNPGSRVDLISLSLRHEHEVPLHRIPFLYALAVQAWLKYNELTERPGPNPPDVPYLTAQELKCLDLCKQGKTNWEIGDVLKISEKTVEWHFSNIMRKLGAANRITAVVMAIQQGLLTL